MTTKYTVTLMAQKVVLVEAESEEEAESMAEKVGNDPGDPEAFWHVEDVEEYEPKA